MKSVIELYRDIVVQIATPYSIGTGFYLQDRNLIVTNEHVVHGNKEVVVEIGTSFRQVAKVLFTDVKFDLAFLEVAQPCEVLAVELCDQPLMEGETVIAIGQPLGYKFSVTQGIVSNANRRINDNSYVQTDAAINPGNSGGPLINGNGEIVGVNTMKVQAADNIGFSLAVHQLATTLQEFESAGKASGTRCTSCANLVFENTIDRGYCPHCGEKVTLPTQHPAYEAQGIARTIESVFSNLGYNVALSRRGPSSWEIIEGSAHTQVSYYDYAGTINAEVVLCLLPKENIKGLYEFLLRENFALEGLTFSMREQEILLSLIIHDRYLNTETATELFRNLFQKSDYYDDLLITKFGALRKVREVK